MNAQRLLPWMLLAGCCALHPAAAGDDVRRHLQTHNVILVTIDGLRWQEVFTGAERTLISSGPGGVRDTNTLAQSFWRESPEERRRVLLPFLWGVVAKQGQLHGNTNRGSMVRVTNGVYVSYPGYNEILTGHPDPLRLFNNAKKPNPNVTVLEWLHRKPAFDGRVAAFCAWDVFPYILNRERARFTIRAGWEPMGVGAGTPRRDTLNRLIDNTARHWDNVIYDSFVFEGAHDHLTSAKPRVLYVAFGEPDDWAHEGRYDQYLCAAQRVDGFIRALWESAQSLPEYRGKTTLLITSDHGRGDGTEDWKNHKNTIPGCEFIWLAALGPDTPALGEMAGLGAITQSQVAATVAALLGEDYRKDVPRAGKPIDSLMRTTKAGQ
jgi:hypothetical protein